MQIEVNIDKEAVQAQLVGAIVNSAIGDAVQKAITEALTAKGNDYGDRRTLVERAVQNALQEQIRIAAEQAIMARRAEISAQIAGKMSDEVVTKMVDAAWSAMTSRLDR